MEITDDLIRSFLHDQCTAEQATAVAAYLTAHPEVLEKYVSETEFLRFTAEAKMGRELKTSVLQKIKAGIQMPPARLRSIRYRSAAAAAVILVLGGWWLLRDSGGPAKNTVAQSRTAGPQGSVKTITNEKADFASFLLEDGSTVKLSPKAAISFYAPFIGGRRDISLKGSAFFMVAKDKTKPFTVYAEGIATTAVGTQFWVYADNRKKITVKLVEGKVVIRSSPPLQPVQDVYLVKGEQFRFDRLSGKVLVNRYTSENSPDKTEESAAGEPAKTSLAFDNQPLEQVFKRIAAKFQTRIIFDKAAIKTKSFTGTFLQTDQLDMILASICNMNDLSFKNNTGRIVITVNP